MSEEIEVGMGVPKRKLKRVKPAVKKNAKAGEIARGQRRTGVNPTVFEENMALLGANTKKAILKLVELLDDGDSKVQLKAAEIILKKTIADKRENVIIDKSEKAVTESGIREAVVSVNDMIDAKMEEKMAGMVVIEETVIEVEGKVIK